MRERQNFSIDQKTNNENVDNLRRYRNPLFETDKGGGTNKSSSTDAQDIDIEKYEKSPRRIARSTNSSNDMKLNTPPAKNANVKDINIEISRTLAAEREVIV